MAVDHDRVAGAHQVVADQVQAHQDALRVLLGPDQGIATDEVVLLGLEWNREADAGLEGVRLVAELGTGVDQSGLHAQHVQGLESERREALRFAGLQDGVPYLRRPRRVAEDLEAQLARVAGARHDDRDAVRMADPGDREAEPAQFLDRCLVGSGPDHLREDLPAERSLDLHVVELVGGVADPCVEAELLRLPAQPESAGVRSADPPEVVGTQSEQRPVVDHSAGVVAHGGVDDLADGQLAYVAGHARLQQQLGVRARHLVLAKR